MASPTDSRSTDDLIDACLRGSRSAWDAIVRQHWRRVFGIAYTFVGKHDDAEDLTQEIFLKLFKSLESFDRRANFQTWLVSIARNFCIDHYRNVRRERSVIDYRVDTTELNPSASGPDPLARLHQLDRRDLLRRAMLKLPDTLRMAVLLRDIQGLSYREIAKRLRVPSGTVKSRINRGRHELARQVAALEHDTGAAVAAAPPAQETHT